MATRRKPPGERRDRQAFQERRLHAAELFAQDVHQAEVARTLGVSRQTVSRWHQRAGRPTAPPGCRAVAHRAVAPNCPTLTSSRLPRPCCRAPRPTASTAT